eukprot:210604-Chlamydomonas_euryale.AAC.3
MPQDIAVIPLLVLLPLYKQLFQQDPATADLPLGEVAATLAPAGLESLGGLALLVLFGRFGLRRVFEVRMVGEERMGRGKGWRQEGGWDKGGRMERRGGERWRRGTSQHERVWAGSRSCAV